MHASITRYIQQPYRSTAYRSTAPTPPHPPPLPYFFAFSPPSPSPSPSRTFTTPPLNLPPPPTPPRMPFTEHVYLIFLHLDIYASFMCTYREHMFIRTHTAVGLADSNGTIRRPPWRPISSAATPASTPRRGRSRVHEPRGWRSSDWKIRRITKARGRRFRY